MGWNNVPPNGFPQIPDIEDLEAVVNDVAGLKTSKANKADIAPTFSATSNYAVGDLVYYEGTLYECTTAHDAAAWNAEHFTETTIEAEIASVQGDVSDLNSTKANQITIAPFFNSETAYDPGDLVYYNGLTYRCVNAHEGEWDADDFAATTISNELDALKSGLIVFHGLQDITSTIEIPSNSYTATDNCILWLHANDCDGSLTNVKPYFNYYINNVKYECIGVEHQTLDLHVFLKRNDVFHFSADYPYEVTLVRSVKII